MLTSISPAEDEEDHERASETYVYSFLYYKGRVGEGGRRRAFAERHGQSFGTAVSLVEGGCEIRWCIPLGVDDSFSDAGNRVNSRSGC